MADESNAFPGASGDAPRPPGRWLDRATAERLLSGAPLEALEFDHARLDVRSAAEAARLVWALAALQALAADGRAAGIGHADAGSAGAGARPGGTADTDAEPAGLPGESAVLAAYRQARDVTRGGAWVRGARQARGSEPVRGFGGGGGRAHGAHAGGTADHAAALASIEIGAVRLGGFGDENGPEGRARTDATRAGTVHRRPVRFGLVATFACCMLGGITIAAAATGILPSPFGGNHGPSPTVSVSEADTPAHPRLFPSASPGNGGGTPSPGDFAGSPSHGSGAGTGGGTADGSTKPGGKKSSENWGPRMISACQDYRGGRDLDEETRQELEDAANGPGHVEHFCKGILGAADSSGNSGAKTGGTADDNGGTSTNGKGKGKGNGKGNYATEDRGAWGHGGGNDRSGGDSARNSGASALPSATDAAPNPSQTPEATAGVTFSQSPTQ